MQVDQQLQTYATLIDHRLDELLHATSAHPSELIRAMRYSCLGPGKRLRPALCLASCEAVGGTAADALDAACALEMVHSFSLIHDDLPALDNDDLRRGRPTCHVQYGESTAILAGDGLFSLAFETLSGCSGTTEQRLTSVQILSQATGLHGLVAGEASDLLAEGREISLEQLEQIHIRKTGALMSAACEIGSVFGGAPQPAREALRSYGAAVGLAFQIADDVLDETSTREQLGKTAGADRARDKATFPRFLGIDKSRERAEQLSATAVDQLQALPGPKLFLEQMALFAVRRQR